MTKGSSIRAILEHAAIREGLVFEPLHELAQHTTLVGLVKAGVGIGALPSLSLKMMDLSGVEIVPLARPHILRELGVVHRKGERFSAATQEFLTAIRRHFLLAGHDGKSLAPEATKPSRSSNRRAK